MRAGPLAGMVIVLVALAGCGHKESAAESPCVVPTDEMSKIVDRADVFAVPQKDGVRCIYGSEGQPIATVSVMTAAQFAAERARFEDNGFLLPKLVAVTGFDAEANVDPRYNSLNVTSGNKIVSVEIESPELSSPGEQLELEKSIARAALENL
jgi:hypothetical protein